MRLLVDLVDAGLAGERDHGRVVEEGVGDPGHEVGRARAQRGHRDGAATGEAAVDVGHERGALLVAGGDVADARVAGERLEDVHRLLAGHGEDVLAALGGEAVDEEVGGRAPLARGHPGSLRAVGCANGQAAPWGSPGDSGANVARAWRARRRIGLAARPRRVSSSQAPASRTIPKAIRNITPW